MNETEAAADAVDPGVEQSQCCEAVRHSLTEAQLAADLRILTAAGSKTRYEVLRLVAAADDGVCVCELEPSLGVSQGAVSQALSRLYTAGLVSRRKEGRWRYYTATSQAQRLLELLDEIRTQNDE